MSKEVTILINKTQNMKKLSTIPKSGSLFSRPLFTTDTFLSSFFQDDFWDTFNSLNRNTTYPTDSYWDKERNYVIEIPLAGYKKDNITLQVDEDYLSLNVEKREKLSDVTYRDEGIRKKELKLKWFLNDTFDKTKISSSFEDGLLKIVLPLKVIKDKKLEVQKIPIE